MLCDLDLLATLPPADLVAGLAEVVKCGFIADPEILDLVEADPAAALDPARPGAARAGRAGDRGQGRRWSPPTCGRPTSVGTRVGRELLNYGHTLGHAIERREHYRWRHGEAISVGMVFVAELARRAGPARRRAPPLGTRPSCPGWACRRRYPPDAFDELLATMAVDKKTRGSTLRFVVLNGLASTEILSGPSVELLRSAYADVCLRLRTHG